MRQRIHAPRDRRRSAGAQLTHDQQRQTLEQIRRWPEHYVAQQPVERSTAPVWNGRAIEPWRLELRTFAVAGKNGYQMMPGGLARVFKSPQTDWRIDGRRPKQQRCLDAVRRPGRAGDAAYATDQAGRTASAAPPICPAAWPTICSGWDATRNGPRPWPGTCEVASCG